ncbi:MAG: enoyl-ACP reductase FabI [Actinobacteria bacterium]|nr:enoyl-ACP reductase FabI [Actinomycetota bacterium]MBW3646668.1 enoyl-ACP reductase FabI [Actinomycetota bacterium]
MTGLLHGKRLVATGVLTESSLASAVVRLARQQGAEVLLSSPVCRGLPLTTRMAPRLDVAANVLELDVTLPEDLVQLERAVRDAGWDRVDGILHAIAYLPDADRSGGFAAAPWEVVAPTLQTGAWSLAALVHALRPLLARGSCVVGLDLDAGRAWPGQDWLGVTQAGLEAVTRYLARELGPDGVRVNLVACGPQRTLLAKAFQGRDALAAEWDARAPLGWDAGDRTAVARAVVALLSDWFPATTGTVVHVDGGAHAVGSALRQ